MIRDQRMIIFSHPMDQAIIEGRKTQTRLIVNPQPDAVLDNTPFVNGHGYGGRGTRDRIVKCLYAPGDRLLVKEHLIEVVGVRVERLQAISDADCLAEGIDPHQAVKDGVTRPYREAYARLWDSIHGVGAWVANSWVWVVEFKKDGGS